MATGAEPVFATCQARSPSSRETIASMTRNSRGRTDCTTEWSAVTSSSRAPSTIARTSARSNRSARTNGLAVTRESRMAEATAAAIGSTNAAYRSPFGRWPA